MFDEDDRPKKKVAHQLGEDLSKMSLDELEERVLLLTTEIERITLAIEAKKASASAAETFFKRS